MVFFLSWLINFFKRLFGISTPSVPSLSSGSSGAKAKQEAKGQGGGKKKKQEKKDDEPELSPGEEEWKEIQEALAKAEAAGIQGDLAGLSVEDPEGYWVAYFAIEEAEHGGKKKKDEAARLGFRDLDHWERVRHYIHNKWCHLTKDDDDEWEVQQKEEFTNAMMRARQSGMMAQMNQAAEADPTLLEPVEGVSVDDWAAAAVAMTKLDPKATAQDVSAALAKFGMDKAKYDRVAAEWQRKMQGDTSFVIAKKYGDAFANAQGQGAGAGEPCTFEHFCEVMTAQEAWAAAGLDVNAQLKAVFGITAADYSQYGSYWSPKMATDIALATKQGELRDKYLAKYKTASPDDDLAL